MIVPMVNTFSHTNSIMFTQWSVTDIFVWETVLPDWRLSIMPKELTNNARIMPDFKFSNYARIILDKFKLCKM